MSDSASFWREGLPQVGIPTPLEVKSSFDFEDHKQVELWIGKHFEGHITWFGPSHEMVVSGETEEGYHADMMEFSDSGIEERSKDLGVYDTFEKAYKAVLDWINGGRQ